MKTFKISTAILLAVLMTTSLFGCAKQKDVTAETQIVTEGAADIKELVETEAEKTGIDLYFQQCSELAEENGKSMRTSSDVWSTEELDGGQEKYTSLGSSIVMTVLYDKELEKVLLVSSSVDIESYASEEIRANLIFDVSVLTAAMINGEKDDVADFCSDFESVIESGVEMYEDDVKLSISADETGITMSAEMTE